MKRNWQGPSICILYVRDGESVNHLFSGCTFFYSCVEESGTENAFYSCLGRLTYFGHPGDLHLLMNNKELFRT